MIIKIKGELVKKITKFVQKEQNQSRKIFQLYHRK